MTGVFGGMLCGDMDFEVRREKHPNVCEMSRVFTDRVALVQAGNLCVDIFLSSLYHLGHLSATPASC